LRKTGGRAQGLVRDVEAEILLWLEGGVVLSPGTDGDDGLRFPGVAVRGRDDLREVGKSPLQLVWATDDAFVRYVVHCCARYHDIVSFSKYKYPLSARFCLSSSPALSSRLGLTKRIRKTRQRSPIPTANLPSPAKRHST
jgi:hypothetical protein